MVDHADALLSTLLGKRLAHLASLADYGGNSVLGQTLDQVRLLGALDDVVDADHVHVHGVGLARRLGVGRYLHAWEEQKLLRLIEHLLELLVRGEAYFHLAVFLAHLVTPKSLYVSLVAFGMHHFRRPAFFRSVANGHPLVGILLESVVVGEGDKVVADVLVGGDGLFGKGASVGPVRMHVQHAAIPARSVAGFQSWPDGNVTRTRAA